MILVLFFSSCYLSLFYSSLPTNYPCSILLFLLSVCVLFFSFWYLSLFCFSPPATCFYSVLLFLPIVLVLFCSLPDNCPCSVPLPYSPWYNCSDRQGVKTTSYLLIYCSLSFCFLTSTWPLSVSPFSLYPPPPPPPSCPLSLFSLFSVLPLPPCSPPLFSACFIPSFIIWWHCDWALTADCPSSICHGL